VNKTRNKQQRQLKTYEINCLFSGAAVSNSSFSWSVFRYFLVIGRRDDEEAFPVELDILDLTVFRLILKQQKVINTIEIVLKHFESQRARVLSEFYLRRIANSLLCAKHV